jgi:predicted MPP superfamily phosphohydrolase
LIGHINSMIVDIKKIPLTIDKNVDGAPNMKIFLVSDVHLGALIRERREKYLVKTIKEHKPDLVLICGDLIDSDIAPVLRKNLGKHIQEIKTPMGVYAVTGNHEYIGGIKQSLAYLKTINVNVLIDTIITLPNGVQIVGRNDRSAGFGPNGQKPLVDLLQNSNHQRPIIVMNHQPYNLTEASDLNVDLHLSGHTHHGQFWPINYITQAMFELSWGYLKKGNSHFYVSSGYGTWGPAIRLGNRPEVVIFDISFKSR